MTIFVLCAGKGERWNDYLGVPKQLVAFGAERLIDRTARLVAGMTQQPLCFVTRDSRIVVPPYEPLLLSSTDSLPQTILATAPHWSERNVILLGDVFYSQRSLSEIVRCVRPIAFFGRPWPSSIVKSGHGELFGLTFAASAVSEVRSLLHHGLSVRTVG